MEGVIFRKERFGGIFFDIKTGKCEYKNEAESKKKLGEIKPIKVIANPLVEGCYLTAPEALGIDITQKCNLRCKHCYKESGKTALNELTKQELFSIINQCEELGVFFLFIAGGEPTCRDDLFEIINYARGKGIRTVLVTNGVYEKDILDKIIKSDVWQVRISIDGSEKINDIIRGKGTFKKSVASIKYLKEKGVDVRISFHLCKINKDYFEDAIKLANSLGVTIKFSTVRPIGRAIESAETEILDKSKFYDTVKKIIALKDKYRIKIISDFDNVISQKPLYTIPGNNNSSCFAAQKEMALTSEGNVYPCSFLSPFKELNSGSIRDNKLIEIWANSSILRAIRNRKPNKKCQNCQYFKKYCLGGCLAVSYALSENLECLDPLCPKEFVENES